MLWQGCTIPRTSVDQGVLSGLYSCAIASTFSCSDTSRYRYSAAIDGPRPGLRSPPDSPEYDGLEASRLAMVETNSVREEKPKLSAKDRLCLIQTINALPLTQFDELVFALDPPKGVVASSTAPQGTRSKDLLDWLEGSTGPGLAAADEVLQVLIPKATWTAPQPVAFVISGKISSSTAAELQAFVELLRKKTGDHSIDIAFFQEGSIEVILNGSPEGLAKLQEMFEAGELGQLATPPVEALASVDINTQEARKARLIQTLRLRWQFSDTPNVTDRIINSPITLVILVIIIIAIAIFIGIIVILLTMAIAPFLKYALARTRTRARARARARARNSILDSDLDLSGADLGGANLRDVNLRKVDLTGANLAYADVTDTIFENNPGLTEADKRDLQRRGAIFLDPPSSDVPAVAQR